MNDENRHQGARPSGPQIQPWHAILLAIITFFIVFRLPGLVVVALVLGSSAWAAVDSSKIQLKRYQSGLSYGPIGVFLGCILLWIVVFPWYLVVRSRIVSGNGVLKPGTARA